jgi:hypothetical protein
MSPGRAVESVRSLKCRDQRRRWRPVRSHLVNVVASFDTEVDEFTVLDSGPVLQSMSIPGCRASRTRVACSLALLRLHTDAVEVTVVKRNGDAVLQIDWCGVGQQLSVRAVPHIHEPGAAPARLVDPSILYLHGGQLEPSNRKLGVSREGLTLDIGRDTGRSSVIGA